MATSRKFLVNLKKREEKVDGTEQAAIKWHLCALSASPLRLPVRSMLRRARSQCSDAPVPVCVQIIADRAGNLFNKESLLGYLLQKARGERAIPAFSHIRSLKDTVELHLTANPSYDATVFEAVSERGSTGMTTHTGAFTCPVTGSDTNGRNRFVTLWTCGCVFAEKAFKEVASKTCFTCGKPFKAADIVRLCQPDEETGNTRLALLEAQKIERAEKASSI